jgi:hypothetical protein
MGIMSIPLKQLEMAKRESLPVCIPKNYYIIERAQSVVATGLPGIVYELYKIHETNATHANVEHIKYIGYLYGQAESYETIAETFMESEKDGEKV